MMLLSPFASASVIVPIMFLSVVLARLTICSSTSSTLYWLFLTFVSSFLILKYTTASTFAFSLSFVIISCLSESTIRSVMFTFIILSMNGIIQLNPGAAKRLYFPNLSITAFCVGLTMRIPANSKNTAMITA